MSGIHLFRLDIVCRAKPRFELSAMEFAKVLRACKPPGSSRLVEKAAFPLRFISPKVTGRRLRLARAFAADAPFAAPSRPASVRCLPRSLAVWRRPVFHFLQKKQRRYENAHHLSTQIQDKQKPVLGQAGEKTIINS